MKKYLCETCGYIYDPAVGDPDGGIAPGTAFSHLRSRKRRFLCCRRVKTTVKKECRASFCPAFFMLSSFQSSIVYSPFPVFSLSRTVSLSSYLLFLEKEKDDGDDMNWIS